MFVSSTDVCRKCFFFKIQTGWRRAPGVWLFCMRISLELNETMVCPVYVSSPAQRGSWHCNGDTIYECRIFNAYFAHEHVLLGVILIHELSQNEVCLIVLLNTLLCTKYHTHSFVQPSKGCCSTYWHSQHVQNPMSFSLVRLTVRSRFNSTDTISQNG